MAEARHVNPAERQTFPVDDVVKFVPLVEKLEKGLAGSEHRQHYGRLDQSHVLWKVGQNSTLRI